MTTKSIKKKHSPGWQEIRSDTGKLLARLNPKKNTLEIKRGPFFYYIDIDEYKSAPVSTNQLLY